MTDDLTSTDGKAEAAAPWIYPNRHFTDAVPETTVDLVNLETYYRRKKADLVFLVKAKNSISFEEAEDVVQEAFTRALRQVQVSQISNLDGWFKKVTRQIVADAHPKPAAHRKRRVRETLMAPADLPDQPWDRRADTLPAEWLEMREEEWLAAEEISALTGKPREVMAEYYHGTPHEEIARLLDISTAAVRQNLARARKALRIRAESRQKDAS